MIKKIISTALMLLMVVSIVYFQKINVYADAKLIIGRGAETPVFEPGEEVRFAIPVENVGQDSARDVIVSLDTSDLKEFPFEMEKMSTTKRVSSINGHGQEHIAFYLKVAMHAEAKTYPVKVNIQYSTDTSGSGSASETVYVKIEGNRQKPSLKVVGVDFKGDSILSGESNIMTLDLQNAGETIAKDIKLSFEGMKAQEIRLDEYRDIPEISKIDPQNFKKVPIKIHANKDLKSGTYELDLVMKYKDESQHAYEEKKKIYIPVNGAGDENLDFDILNVQYPKEGIATSEDFIISFDLKNRSEKEAKRLNVSIDGGENILPKSASIKNIRTLGSEESTHLEYIMFAKDDTEAKNYPVKINIEYNLGPSEDEAHTMTQYVGVFVKGDRSKLTPKIIIDDYEYSKEYIEGGETFPLRMSFVNTSQSSNVKNIKVSFTSEGDIFIPVENSNSFFIDEIKAQQRVQKIIQMKPKVDAEQKTYNVVAHIEYEDASGKSYKSDESIGIPVIQKLKFVVSNIEMPEEENFVGSPIGLSVQFYNMGRSMIRNVMIHTDGKFETKDGNLFVGNVESGKDDYYDVTIIPQKEGKLSGKIVFEYEDTVGNAYTTEKNFDMEIQKDVVPPMPEDMKNMEEEKPSSKKWIYIGVGIIIVVTLGILYRKRRRRKAEEVDVDE